MMSNVYNYVFHFNPSTKMWNAIPRDKYLEYWSTPVKQVEGVLRSKDIQVLTELIDRGEEFVKTL